MIKIISGGQSGVDRAALDVARHLFCDYGGWCPRGGLAEDYPSPPGLLKYYPALHETPTSDYAERTEWNVRDSDATLIIAPHHTAAETGGTGQTQAFAEEHNKPFFVACLDQNDCYQKARYWFARQRESTRGRMTLNVAGPRLSKAPDVYRDATAFLEKLLQEACVKQPSLTGAVNDS